MATNDAEEKCEKDSGQLSADKEENASDGIFSGMLLDVLAQVASDRLEIVDYTPPRKKAPKRAVQNMDRLDFEQIKSLSDKLLVSLFSDMTCDEIKKQYTLTCYLMPRSCQFNLTCYGNEMKARHSMRTHLRGHIDDIEKIKSEDQTTPVFIAEPVPARKKRLAVQYNKEQKGKRGKKTGTGIIQKGVATSPRQRRGRPPNFPQSLQDYAELGMDIDTEPPKEKDERVVPYKEGALFTALKVKDDGPVLKSAQESLLTGQVTLSYKLPNQRTTKPPFHPESSTTDEAEDNDSAKPLVSLENQLDKEQLIIDLMQKEQPFQDHNYTSILGRKITVEFDTKDEDGDTDHASPGDIEVKVEGNNQIMFLEFPGATVFSDTIPVLRSQIEGSDSSQELVLQELTRLADKMTQKSDANPAYTSSRLGQSNTEFEQNYYPQVDGEQQARLAADEANLLADSGEDDSTVTADVNPHRRGRKGLENTSSDWERKAALKCIRELRGRKRDDQTLVCKICKDKTFTATATLLYHYRSHAGIKPFVCLICNTTFTRQHSLNYHMLIHNNQSRFTCKECGRKFRHPSHFKEHMRRHTGETPYHCTDCPLRFKTRNTYKRHLRTRHDKLLTSCGIQKMSFEEVEFNKAMQEYAMKRQHNQTPQPEKPTSTEEEEEEEVEEEEEAPVATVVPGSPPPLPPDTHVEGVMSGFKSIAPKMATGTGTTGALNSTAHASSALAQALLAPMPATRKITPASAPPPPTSSVTTFGQTRDLEIAVSTVASAGGTGSIVGSGVMVCSSSRAATVSCTTATAIPNNNAIPASALLGNLPYLQPSQTGGTNALTCLAPLASGPSSAQPLILGTASTTPGLQPFIMALPQTPHGQPPSQPTAFLATSHQQQHQHHQHTLVSLATLNSTPTLVTSAAGASLLVAPQSLVALSNAQGLGLPENVLMATSFQPLLTPLQTVHTIPTASLVPTTLGTSALTLTPQAAAQLMGITLNQANFFQPFQALQGGFHIEVTQAGASYQITGFQNSSALISTPNTSQTLTSTVDTLSQYSSHSVGAQNKPSNAFGTHDIAGLQFVNNPQTMSFQSVMPVITELSGTTRKGLENLFASTQQSDLGQQQNSQCLPGVLINHPSLSTANLVDRTSVMFDSTVNSTAASVDALGNITSTAINSSTAPMSAQDPDTPATRTLLKFCTQVAHQMGQVIPTTIL